MKKHNNNIKKKDKSPKTNLNEMEISDLSEREFKITKILSEVRTVMHVQNESSKKKKCLKAPNRNNRAEEYN